MSSDDKTLEIIKKIVNVSPEQFTAANLSEIEDIIKKKIPETMKSNAPMNFPELYGDFCSEFERFKEFILFEPLIGKTVAALGGGFSSGKSSFLNALMSSTAGDGSRKNNILPAAIDPSTSVPAYIVNSRGGASACGFNIFNAAVELDIEDIKPISHGFGSSEDDPEDSGIQMGQLLKTIFASTPLQPFESLAFLDTPGYSKAESADHSDKTDESIARRQLNGADCIMWFIDADRGTFPEEDIQFLRSVENPKAPLLIIINKADKKTDSDLRDIKETVKNIARQRGINFVDVCTFSRKKGTEDKYDRARIMEILRSWNKPVTESNFAYNFSMLFIKCRDYIDERISEENRRVGSQKKALTLAESEDVVNILRELSSESSIRLAELKRIRSGMNELRSEFFTELRRIASVIGIKLPEADEVDVAYAKMLESGTNPLKVAEEYCRSKNIDSSGNYRALSDKMGSTANGDEANEKNIFDMLNRQMNGAEPKGTASACAFRSMDSAFGGMSRAKSASESALDKLNSLFK